ncbi:glycoside hydrolase [Agreia sp. Leaf283]|uniref:glycoside hydrolase n=1 Tax=Agreia sp. Leaf283 TaxID=1736321 RepID=UPI0009E87A12|nr:glycoside hydrolase [Agreia sp. Leaf283]
MTKTSPLKRRVLAATTALALGALTLGVGATAAPSASAAESTPITITPNPAYQGESFEGWGTSLVWFANATGGYPDSMRQELLEKVFGEDGLNLNIARYNIGGGNATDVPPYLRAGGAVEGWWNPDLATPAGSPEVTSTYADRDAYAAAWDASDPDAYNLDADKTQRWWVSALKDKITKWEAFSNSPPYFMTESGYVSGGFDSSAEQLKPSAVEDFATYLKTAAQTVENEEGISFDTIEPVNEPNTNYWGTTIDPATGWPKKGGQEGAHVGPAMQDAVVKALAAELAKSDTTTTATISAMDETNPGTFVTNWNGWTQEAKDSVSQLNVHTYGTSGRVNVRDIAKTADKPLWMSEIEGDWDGTGVNNQTNMNNGIGMATRVMDDLRELEPSAWVLWQPVEDYYNMQKVEKLNWGSVLIDFDCNADGNSVRRLADGDADPSCKIVTNAKYNTLRNFTHYIHPGDHIIPSTNAQTTSAVSADGSGVTLVHANSDSTARTITVDLSKFGAIAPGATLTPIVTTESPADDTTKNALIEGAPVAIDLASKTAVVTVPAKSVSTFVIDGVSGIAQGASPLEDGHTYRIVGKQSGKAITANTGAPAGSTPGATITALAATTETAGSQVWTAEKVTNGTSNAERYVLRSASGLVLAADSQGTLLVDSTRENAAATPSQQWILTTTDGATWSLVNAASPQALEVPGGSTAEGAPVNVYSSNGGANQAWSFQDTTLSGFAPVVVSTIAGIPAQLPATVTPLYNSGPGAPVAVTWNTEGVDWNAGPLTIPGSGTDLFGTAFTDLSATVEVGGFVSTDPVSLTSYAGVSREAVIAAAPATVPARIGQSSNRFDAPVSWDFDAVTTESLASVGVVTVPGSAQSNDPSAEPLAATLSVILTEPGETNVAPLPSTTAQATSTESGYPVDNTRNDVTSDKGWSNWRSGTKSTSDTLSYDLGSSMPLTHAKVYFYKDGGTTSWASEITVQYTDASGAWTTVPGSPTTVETPADGSAPVVDVPLSGISTAQLRVVLTAYPNTHMIVSEVQIFALASGVASVSDLARLSVNGTAVDGFDGSTLEYAVPLSGSALPVVTASPVDTAATVEITQPTSAVGPDAAANVTVTAADGETVSRYTVSFPRTVTVAPVILGDGVVGSELVATATVDPADAALSYAWTRNGELIEGAVSAQYTPTATDVGASIAVTATAVAEGYSTASADSRTVVIAAAGTGQPGTGEPASGSTKPSVNVSDAAGTGGGALARTGVDPSWSLALGAGGLLLAVGVALTAVRRRRSSLVE